MKFSQFCISLDVFDISLFSECGLIFKNKFFQHKPDKCPVDVEVDCVLM